MDQQKRVHYFHNRWIRIFEEYVSEDEGRINQSEGETDGNSDGLVDHQQGYQQGRQDEVLEREETMGRLRFALDYEQQRLDHPKQNKELAVEQEDRAGFVAAESFHEKHDQKLDVGKHKIEKLLLQDVLRLLNSRLF